MSLEYSFHKTRLNKINSLSNGFKTRNLNKKCFQTIYILTSSKIRYDK